MEITRHFTATTQVVFENKVVLHKHKKHGIWLPPGGHIDRDELPEDAALREVKEETGLDAELYNPIPPRGLQDVRELIQPVHMILEDINQFHQHIDLIYFAKALNSELRPGDGEAGEVQWFTKEEIENLGHLPDDAREYALEALRILGI